MHSYTTFWVLILLALIANSISNFLRCKIQNFSFGSLFSTVSLVWLLWEFGQISLVKVVLYYLSFNSLFESLHLELYNSSYGQLTIIGPFASKLSRICNSWSINIDQSFDNFMVIFRFSFLHRICSSLS